MTPAALRFAHRKSALAANTNGASRSTPGIAGLCVLMLWLLCGQSVAGQAWPQAGYDESAAGRGDVPGPHRLKVDWQYPLDGWATSPIVDEAGTVYVATQHGTLNAVTSDGEQKWRRRWRGPELQRPQDVSKQEWEERVDLGLNFGGRIVSCALLTDGRLVVAQDVVGTETGTSQLLFLDRETGQTLHRVDITPARFAGKITVGSGSEILFTTTDHLVHCVSSQGETLWQTSLPDVLSSVAVGANGVVYVGGDQLRGLDLETGAIRFEASPEVGSATWVFGPAVADDGTVYIPSGVRASDEPCLYAFTPELQLKWKLRVGVVEMTPAVAPNGDVILHVWGRDEIGVHHKPGLGGGGYRISPEGRAIWHLPPLMAAPPWMADDVTPGRVLGSDSSPIIGGDGLIYFGADIGKVFAVVSDGAVLSEVSLGGEFDTRPAIGPTGRLFIAHAGGPGAAPHGRLFLYAFSEQGREVEPPVAQGSAEDTAAAKREIAYIRVRIEQLEQDIDAAREDSDKARLIQLELAALRGELDQLESGG